MNAILHDVLVVALAIAAAWAITGEVREAIDRVSRARRLRRRGQP